MSEKMVEYLAESCNLYVSNIRLRENSAVLLPVVESMNPNLFSAEDWSTSLSYIFMKDLRFETSASAKEYYVKELQKKYDDNNHR